MTEKVRGANRPTILRHLLPIAAVLLLVAVMITPVAADIEITSTADATQMQKLAEAVGGTAVGNSITLNGVETAITENVTISLADPTQELVLTGTGTIKRAHTGYLFNVTGGTLVLGGTGSNLIIHGNDTYYNDTTTVNPEWKNTQGLININGAGAKLVMNEGTTLTHNNISNTDGGGAVFIKSGAEFEMKGGELSYNHAKYGGCVVNHGEMIVSGGTITHNKANSGGFIDNYGLLLISGGAISNNFAQYGAGGIYNNGNGLITISGGEIVDNTADSRGGAIYNGGGKITISGGDISRNHADTNAGGGIFNQGELTISGGKISYNSAITDRGGGIYSDKNLTMSGGEISYNTAYLNEDDRDTFFGGGGVHIYGNFTMTGGIIAYNKGHYGGGVMVSGESPSNDISNTDCMVSILGGEISHNIATKSGGGIHTNSSSTMDTALQLLGGQFLNNSVRIETQPVVMEVLSLEDISEFILSGDCTIESGSCISYADYDFTTTISKPFMSNIFLRFVDGSKYVDGQTLITIAPDCSQTTEDLLTHISPADTSKYILYEKDSKNIATGYNKPVATSATVEWINSTIANVTITLDPKANDATSVKVYFNETDQPLGTAVGPTGTEFVKGSSISDLQFTGLDPEKTYSVVVVLKNTNVVSDEFTYVLLQNIKPPMPDTVEITGDGGAEIPDNKITLVKDGNVTLSVNVSNKTYGILKNEYVTWELASGGETFVKLDGYTVSDKTLTVKINGTAVGTDTLTAKTEHGTVASTGIIITVVDTKPTLEMQVTPQTLVCGIDETAELTAMATASSNNYFGEEITWAVSPATLTKTGGDKSGETATFTATTAGTYTVTASLKDDSTKTATATLIFVGKPTIDTDPIGKTYTQWATADPLSVVASAPVVGKEVSYQWYSSTDKNFGTIGTEITGATEATYTPSTEEVGTLYYRVKVSYTQNEYTTTNYSKAAEIIVIEPTVDSINVDTTSVTLYVGGSPTTITATAMNTSVNHAVSGLVWSISSGNSVKISQNGDTVTITPVKEGVSIITASAGGKEQAVTITVKPASDAPTDTGGSTPSGSSGSSTWLPSEPTETPTEPTQTPTDVVPTDIPSTQPTEEPKSPGFGVLAVLAGLGAVAVLRRK